MQGEYHFRPSTPGIFWEDGGSLKLDVTSAPFKIFYLALHVWHRWKASILGAWWIGWVNVKYAVFRTEVPELHGSNLVFLGLSGENFTDMQGEYHFRPSPPGIFWEDGGLWNLMSLQRLSKFLFSIRVSGTAERLPFWEHCKLAE